MQKKQNHKHIESFLEKDGLIDGPHYEQAFVLLFSDDSTLFFALRMRECLISYNQHFSIKMAWVTKGNTLSYRQMTQLLPEGPDIAIENNNDFAELIADQTCAAILTSRPYAGLTKLLRNLKINIDSNRPCVISFLGGLEFYPERGYPNRRLFDVIYVFPKTEVSKLKASASTIPNRMWQAIGFGHPSFVGAHATSLKKLERRADIYFFTQAISPSTRRGRLHMLKILAAIAIAYPDRKVWIKLRHLPDENQSHIHQEQYDYPRLLSELKAVPQNLQLTACKMDEALETAAIGITCTSTAAIDLVRAGIPCMVHLDFVDNYMDPLVAPMRKLFEKSDLIKSLDDLLNLRAKPPNSEWLDNMFCPPDLAEKLIGNIKDFQNRPFQLSP